MKISIIIVSYNTKELLKSCLDSVFSDNPALQYETIVIDNASTDGSRRLLEEYKGIKTVFNNDNIGFAAANNIGIKNTVGEYVLLLNSDTILLKGSVELMIEQMERNPAIGILGPKLLGAGHNIVQVSWEFPPSIFGESLKKLLSPKNIRRFTLIKKIVRWLQRKSLYVRVVTGAAMLVRRQVFQDVGMLDEDYFIYFEDTDFCTRAFSAGWKILFYPGAVIIHMLGGSAAKDTGRHGIEYRRSQMLYYRKHLSGWQQKMLKLYFGLRGYNLKNENRH